MAPEKPAAAVDALRRDIASLADPAKVEVLQHFFKTGKGQYGEGDVFIGLKVPQSRQLAKKHSGIALEGVKELLYSKIHEERLVGLLILVLRFKADPEGVARFYLDNLSQVNSWDLVDTSAPAILGAYLKNRDRSILYKLARSERLWDRRVAIITTRHFIRSGDYGDTLKICEMLLGDSHDLIHKAAGWMLREVGKRDTAAEETFLQKHCKKMPRTMLRYAVEKLPEKKRRAYVA